MRALFATIFLLFAGMVAQSAKSVTAVTFTGGTISLTVYDCGNLAIPLEGVAVTVLDKSLNVVAGPYYTDSSGQVTINGLSPGEYIIVISHEDAAPKLMEVEIYEPDPWGNDGVIVAMCLTLVPNP